jgi:hypothetical protein
MALPEEVDVNGLRDEERDITYWGKATRKDGEWVCYANVAGSLCIVAVNITFDAGSKIRFSRTLEV